MSEHTASEIPDDLRPYLDTIADRLLSGHAAVMVGAGFSRNAAPLGVDRAFPNWSQLGDRFYERLHGRKPEPNRHYLQVPALAHEIEAAFGRPALDQMLRDAIPDFQHEPSALHIKLLDLPWSDVFTTNYDTLLERACRDVISQRYDIIVNPEDLAHSKRPRIVKLHGSLPSDRSFIVTDEDYRRYPQDFAPFVNVVRQALLENTLCLIGFSGDDPNFLQWIGWIHDNLGYASSPKMYLIGSLRLSRSQETLLERRNIIPIDMSLCSGVEGNHYGALELFLDHLRSRRVNDNRLDWPTTGHDTAPSSTDNPAELLATWRSQRRKYPGWVVLPEDRRQTLWLRTRHWTRELPSSDSLSGTLALQFAFELAWRMERCLCPIFDNQAAFIRTALDQHCPATESAVPVEPSGADAGPPLPHTLTINDLKHMCNYLLLILMRYYREEGLSTKWKDANRRLQAVIATLHPEHAARLRYERALFALFSMNLQELKTRLAEWPRNDALPFWDARKAGLLAEIGRADEAQQVLEQSLQAIRAKLNLTPTTKDYALVSQESFVMFILHATRPHLLLTDDDVTSGQIQPRDFRERWHALRQYKCDPWHDIELFKHMLGRPPVNKSNVTEGPTFDIGRIVQTSHFIGWDSEALTAYSFLRFCEDAGIPFRIPGRPIATAIATDSAAGTLTRIAGHSSYWALATVVRIGDVQVVDEIFDRASLAKLDTAVVDELVERYLEALRLAAADIEKVQSRGDHNFGRLLADVVPEILSRLCCKCSHAIRERLVDFLLGVYKSEHRWKFGGIRHLTGRLLGTISPSQRVALIPKLLEFPILTDLDPLTKQEFVNPFDFMELPRDLMVKGPEIAEEVLDLLFAKGASHVSSTRMWAVDTIGRLHDRGLLNDARSREFGEILWGRTSEDGMPADTNYYPHAFLEFPYPPRIDPVAAFMAYVRGAHFPAQESSRSTKVEIGGSQVALCHEIQASKRFPWSADDVRGFMDRLVSWWDSDKGHLERVDVPGLFSSIGDALRKRMSQLVETLAVMIERHFEFVESENLRDIMRRVVQELSEYSVPALRLQTACVRLFPEWREPVLQRVETEMASWDVEVAVDALLAMDLVSQRPNAAEADVVRLLRGASQMISWRRETEAWAATINIAGSVLKRHPGLLVGDVERWVLVGLERVEGQTVVSGKSSGKVDNDAMPAERADVMTKLFVRRAAARLAFRLFGHYRGLRESSPEAVKTWERICGSDEEFAEVRNQWVGSSVE